MHFCAIINNNAMNIHVQTKFVLFIKSLIYIFKLIRLRFKDDLMDSCLKVISLLRVNLLDIRFSEDLLKFTSEN